LGCFNQKAGNNFFDTDFGGFWWIGADETDFEKSAPICQNPLKSAKIRVKKRVLL
jgi:hypothetical protein